MKLYTQEQVLSLIHPIAPEGLNLQATEDYLKDYLEYYLIKNKLTPIELPSDEEIRNESAWFNDVVEKVNWREGAKWVKEYILKQNK